MSQSHFGLSNQNIYPHKLNEWIQCTMRHRYRMPRDTKLLWSMRTAQLVSRRAICSSCVCLYSTRCVRSTWHLAHLHPQRGASSVVSYRLCVMKYGRMEIEGATEGRISLSRQRVGVSTYNVIDDKHCVFYLVLVERMTFTSCSVEYLFWFSSFSVRFLRISRDFRWKHFKINVHKVSTSKICVICFFILFAWK